MTNVVKPTHRDWEDLELIVENVEMIVCDAYERTSSNFTGGLLSLFPEPELPETASKLSTTSLLSRHTVERILNVLPGSDNLGVNRSERVNALTLRLKELPAYLWLARQSSYRDALALIRKKASEVKTKESIGDAIADAHRRQQGYAKDTSEYLLLKTFLPALILFSIYKSNAITPPYPTKAEMEKALSNAKQLSKFLNERFMVKQVIEVSPFLDKALASFVLAAKEKVNDYTKPKADDTLNARLYMERVIKGCWAAFGECSPTLVTHLSRLVDYEIDASDLSKKIKAVKGQLAV